MVSKVFSVNLTPALRKAVEDAAADARLTVGMYLRSLAEVATGVQANPLPGTQGLSKEKRRAIGELGAAVRWGK